MGVERAVTRWYVQRQSLLNEIAALQARVEQNSSPAVAEQAELGQKLAQAQAKLRMLGPCPKPMMG